MNLHETLRACPQIDSSLDGIKKNMVEQWQGAASAHSTPRLNYDTRMANPIIAYLLQNDDRVANKFLSPRERDQFYTLVNTAKANILASCQLNKLVIVALSGCQNAPVEDDQDHHEDDVPHF